MLLTLDNMSRSGCSSNPDPNFYTDRVEQSRSILPQRKRFYQAGLANKLREATFSFGSVICFEIVKMIKLKNKNLKHPMVTFFSQGSGALKIPALVDQLDARDRFD